MRTPRSRATPAKTKTRRWDPTEYLEDPEDVVAYLEVAFEDGDSSLIAAALGDVARSKGMTKVASETGLGRESLYKALSLDGNPGLATVLKVLRALGIQLYPSATSRAHPLRNNPEPFWDTGFASLRSDLFVFAGEHETSSVIRGSSR